MEHLLILINILTLSLHIANANFVLGGIFDENPEDEDIFNRSIDFVNSQNGDKRFSASTRQVSAAGDHFQAQLATCALLEGPIVTVFGPRNADNVNMVQSICDEKDVPHIVTTSLYQDVAKPGLSGINLFPNPRVLSLAYLDLVEAWQWRSFMVLFDDDDSFLRLVSLIGRAKEKDITVTVEQLVGDEKGYRATLKEVQKSGEVNFVIDCKLDVLEEVLLQAQQVGLMTSAYSYFVTNLDLRLIDIEPFQYCGANITGVSLLNTDNNPPLLSSLSQSGFPPIDQMKTETALLFDGVLLISRAVNEVSNVPKFNVGQIACDTSNSFQFGSTITNFIKGADHEGLTGTTRFDNGGLRSFFNLDVIGVTESGFRKIGVWNTTRRLSTYPLKIDREEDDPASLRNKHFIVITCLTKPYGMLKETTEQLYGNDRFEGFGIDLIHELSLLEGFNYTFILQEDKKNGAREANGEWSGMIGELMRDRAHFAITDLTITSQREEAVDFSSPFMSLGISILGKKPQKAPPSFFSFAAPFGLDTWIGLALAYAAVTFTLFMIGRLCPDEWTNPFPCVEEPEFLLNQFSLQNSGWFTVGSLMQQGTEIAPLGISTRMIAGMWWFFVLIMVSSYTANLAASLASENTIYIFEDVETLVENQEKYKIRMGAKAGGATASFFKNKSSPVYQAIEKYMAGHPEDMVKENDDGVALAEKENYAFFMESTSIEYEIQRHCSLQKYGDLLDDKGYGIAMKKNSTYRKRLSMAILQLQSSGLVDNLKRKWWEERRGGGQCLVAQATAEALPLYLENLEGVFYVTIGGLICSMVCVVMEMVVYTITLSLKAKITLGEAFKYEMAAYLNFNSNVKPVMKAKSKSKSGGSSKELQEDVGAKEVTEGKCWGDNGTGGKDRPASYGFVVPSASHELLTGLHS